MVRQILKKNIAPILLLLLITIGGILRFYNLNWGAPFYFHPDERNIASAVTRIQLPEISDPEFYAYGSLPIYIVAAIVHVLKLIFQDTDPFFLAILTGRTISALFSTLLIPIIYLIGKQLFSPRIGLIAAIIATVTPGFIQYAHFGTFEIWLTLSRFLLFAALLSYLHKPSFKNTLSIALLLGITISIKITSLLYTIPVALVLLYPIMKQRRFRLFQLLNAFIIGSFIVGIAASIFIVSNPYAFKFTAIKLDPTQINDLDTYPTSITEWEQLLYPPFLHSMNIEGGIARGTIETFYTRQFNNANPLAFPLIKIWPWILSPLLVAVAFISLPLFTLKSILNRKPHSLLLLLFFFIHIAFTSVLFVKWTRYLIPSLPYLILMISWFLVWITKIYSHRFTKIFVILALIIQLAWSLMFFQVYLQSDTRIQAATWASQHLPPDTTFLSEVYDLGIVPFNSHFLVQNIELFNFYDLDTHQHPTSQDLLQSLEQADVFIVLSRRVWGNVLEQPDTYPLAAGFYQQLFLEKLGLTKVAEFQASPQLLGFTFPDQQSSEETFTVFDHPHLQIWARPGIVLSPSLE